MDTDTERTVDLPDIRAALTDLGEFVSPHLDVNTGFLPRGEHPEGVEEAHGILQFVGQMRRYSANVDWEYLVYSWACIQHDVDAENGDEPTKEQLIATRAEIDTLLTLAQAASDKA